MQFLNIGPAEMILILVLALIVFGPGKLPEIGRAVGKSIGEFRRATSELTKEFSDSISEVKQPFDEIRQLATGPVPTPERPPATTVACPQCAAPNPLDHKFCRACGARLQADESTVSCPQCAVLNPGENRFCRECGTALPTPAASEAVAAEAGSAQPETEAAAPAGGEASEDPAPTAIPYLAEETPPDTTQQPVAGVETPEPETGGEAAEKASSAA